jgi:aspartate beta-hydroxylase
MHLGTLVDPLCGPSNLNYRYHLTIRVADCVRIRLGDVWRSWEQDRCLILDDSLEHEVLHEGDVRRVVLIVDCWHPDLSAKERDFVTRVHRVWRQPQSAR